MIENNIEFTKLRVNLEISASQNKYNRLIAELEKKIPVLQLSFSYFTTYYYITVPCWCFIQSIIYFLNWNSLIPNSSLIFPKNFYSNLWYYVLYVNVLSTFVIETIDPVSLWRYIKIDCNKVVDLKKKE